MSKKEYASIKLDSKLNKLVDQLLEGTGYVKQVFIDNAVRNAITADRELMRTLKERNRKNSQ